MKKKFILILSLVALLSCIFVVSASADNGYAPSDIYLTNIGEFAGSSDYSTIAVVDCRPYFDENDNMYCEIVSFSFNNTFFGRYVVDNASVENVVVSYFAVNPSFNVRFYSYDGGSITEKFYSYDYMNPPYSQYWDNFVSSFRSSVEQQFGGWFERISSSSSTTVYSFSESLKDHMSAYKEACTSSGTAATYEGFNEYIEQNATSDFKANYNDNMKAFAQDMFSAGASSSTSSGGSSGGSSGSSGSGGSPNIPDDELGSFTGDFSSGANGCYICGGGSDSLGCQHYQYGYVEGYDDALRSDTNKSNLQEAFDQGYYYANSEDFSTTIQNRIEESRDTHIEEYKKSTEFTEYLLSEEFTSSENHSKVVANYCNTQEFVDMLLDNQSIGMNNFKASDEYAAVLAAERLAGKDDGYQLGLEEGSISGYERGVDDGYAMFRGSDLFNQTLNQWYQNGYHDGVDDSTEDGPSIVGIVSLIIILAGVLIATVLINLKFNKKKSSKRK